MAIRRSMTIESKLLGLLIFSAAVMGLGAFITWLGMSNPYATVRKQAADNDAILQGIEQQLNQLNSDLTRYEDESKPILNNLEKNPQVTARIANLEQSLQNLRNKKNLIIGQVNQLSRNSAELAQNNPQNVVTIVSIIFIFGIIINLILGFLITRNITRSLSQAVEIAEEVSAGNLTTRVEVVSDDEIGQLLAALKTMTENLNSLISKVQQSGIQITSSTTQMASSRKQLESTLSQQIASTNQVTATSQDIANTSGELVKTMEQVAELAHSTANAASQGQNDLVQMEKTMRQLLDATTSIASKLGIMSEKAHNINSVVLTITKVADQTNLLSLNAAIEAEKAGEYGAGFAVVAREIRRLADQTAVATLEIEQMVKEMQSAVSTGVMEMDKFNKEVTSTVTDVGGISRQIAQVIEQVQSITPRFELVSKRMEEQSHSARHIREAMEQLSEGSEPEMLNLYIKLYILADENRRSLREIKFPSCEKIKLT
jgi:methyl-accepting chemotaxis protein WspA